MKVNIYYERDSKQILYCSVADSYFQTDESYLEFKGKVYIFSDKAFTDAIPYFMQFSFLADISYSHFKHIFVERCIKVI